MKKVLLSLALVFGLTMANAQDNQRSQLLPKQGDWSISFGTESVFEYVGNLFTDAKNEAPKFASPYGAQFVGKLMTTDMTALRFIGEVGIQASSVTLNGTNKTYESGSKNRVSLTLGMGKEWRKGSKRLQGYYGCDGLLSINSQTMYSKNIFDGELFSKTMESDGCAIGVGARAFVGVEYFITEGIALGAEYNYTVGMSYKANSKKEVEMNKKSSLPEDFKRGGTFLFDLGGEKGLGVASLRVAFYF